MSVRRHCPLLTRQTRTVLSVEEDMTNDSSTSPSFAPASDDDVPLPPRFAGTLVSELAVDSEDVDVGRRVFLEAPRSRDVEVRVGAGGGLLKGIRRNETHARPRSCPTRVRMFIPATFQFCSTTSGSPFAVDVAADSWLPPFLGLKTSSNSHMASVPSPEALTIRFRLLSSDFFVDEPVDDEDDEDEVRR